MPRKGVEEVWLICVGTNCIKKMTIRVLGAVGGGSRGQARGDWVATAHLEKGIIYICRVHRYPRNQSVTCWEVWLVCGMILGQSGEKGAGDDHRGHGGDPQRTAAGSGL